jgi:phosphoglycolate phosphatase-like HAD superfamily hydrolase
MPLRGVIFDLDGTLADTLPVCFAAFREVFRDALGRDYTDQQVRAMFGPAEEGVLQRIIPHDWERRLEQYLAAYQRLHSLCPEPFPGIRLAVDSLRRREVRMAIVTGKGPQSAAISLRELGLEGIFDPVEAGSPTGGVKPDAMRRVLDSWGLEPNEVASLGDARPDIESSRQLGMTSLAASWATTANFEMLSALEPDAIFQSVEEFHDWIAFNVG